MYPFWNNTNNWRKMNDDLNQMHRIMNHFINDSGVQERLEGNNVVHAKIKYGDKVYKIVMEEVVPKEDSVEIEFDDPPPEKHPDFTE